MNYMKQVAEMLGVELGERFKIKYDTETLEDTFYLTEDGCHHSGGTISPKKLNKLITGTIEIVKLPWKPKTGDDYYIVHPNGTIGETFFYGNVSDYAMLYMGNCFPTEAEAETHKDEIMAKYREVMER